MRNFMRNWTAGERRKFARNMQFESTARQIGFSGFRLAALIAPVLIVLGLSGIATAMVAHHGAGTGVLVAGAGIAAMPVMNVNPKQLHALRQQKIDLKNEAQEILDKVFAAENKATPEQQKRLDELKTSLEATNAILSSIESFLDDERHHGKVVQTPGAVSRDLNGKKVYAKLGDQMVANGMKPTSRSGELAPFESLADQMRAIRNSEVRKVVDPRLAEIQAAALGGNESAPADGGFLVIPEYAQQLIQHAYDTGLLINRCFKMPMNSARLIMHAVDEDSRVDGSRWGGVLGYWLAEAGTYTATKPKFREMQLVANKLIALCYATEEQLQDGPAWEAYVREAVPQELAFKIDTAIVSGAGAGQPLGFLNSGAVVSVAKEGSQTAATVVTNNVLKMHKRMFARSRPTAAWLINQEIEDQLYTLAFANPSGSVLFTTPMYVPPGYNGNNTPYGMLLGKPVIPIEQASALGTQGDINLVDLQQYLLAQHSDVRADTSIHVAFLTGEQAFRFMLRVDGQPMWKKPLTPYKGSSTLSPFITLDTRA